MAVAVAVGVYQGEGEAGGGGEDGLGDGGGGGGRGAEAGVGNGAGGHVEGDTVGGGHHSCTRGFLQQLPKIHQKKAKSFFLPTLLIPSRHWISSAQKQRPQHTSTKWRK